MKLTTGNKIMWKRREIAPLFHIILYIYFLTSGVKLHIHLLNVVVRVIVFLTLSTRGRLGKLKALARRCGCRFGIMGRGFKRVKLESGPPQLPPRPPPPPPPAPPPHPHARPHRGL